MNKPKIGPLFAPEEIAAFEKYVGTMPADSCYLEIGSYFGGSLCLAAWVTRKRGAVVYGLDPLFPGSMPSGAFPPEYQATGDANARNMLVENVLGCGSDAGGRIRLIPGFSKGCLGGLKDLHVGFLLIDGEHSYDAVMNDAEYVNLVVPGGFVAIHDAAEYAPEILNAATRVFNERWGELEEVARIGSLLIGRKRTEMIDGMMTPGHRQSIVDAIRERCALGSPVFAVEIGAAVGQGAKTWATTMRNYAPKGSRLYEVDPFCDTDPTVYGPDYKTQTLSPEWVTQYTAGRFKTMRDAVVANIAESGYDAVELCEMKSEDFFKRSDLPEFDVIFHDGNHSYKSVSEDLRSAWSRLKTGGLLFVHDYRHYKEPEVEPAFNDWLLSLDETPKWVDLGGMAEAIKC